MADRKISYEQDRALAHGRSVARANQARRTAAKLARERAEAERERVLREHVHGWKNWEYDFSDMTETRVCRICGESETRKIRL
jgi:hypothetical protein